MIRKLLIANRGEIACRIMATARRLGIATVAVFSDADAEALHVTSADEAVHIGASPARDSYLNIDAILNAAQICRADAVHPGYGFLSENADFAQACIDIGLIFVGPPASAIAAMGDKARARRIAADAGVRTVPGYDGEDQSDERLLVEAKEVGFPLLIKASAGGGGRGMRRVHRHEEFADALASARREAQSAFGDDRMLLERLIEEARHIEVQVFADRHGAVVHLGERDCSAQRRHQKIIEEAPSAFVNVELRARMGADAVKLARIVGYEGAGTVEFIVGQDGSYFFLEMNTRLQVEHPVTEGITGFDLVEWQLRIAAGEALPVAQEDVGICGHAIEARLYGEDPYEEFRPQAGRIIAWKPDMAGGRVDNGYLEGATVSPFYDPMIAKFIAHGRDRAEAVSSLSGLLRRSPLFGVATNRTFLIDLLGTPEFAAGEMTTGAIDRWQQAGHPIFQRPRPGGEGFALAGAIIALREGGDWFRSTGFAHCPITLVCDGVESQVEIAFSRGSISSIEVDGEVWAVEQVMCALPKVRWRRGGVWREAAAMFDGSALWLDLDGKTFRFDEPDLLAPRSVSADPSRIVSPVSGLVRTVSISVGDHVVPGQTVAVVEAMKMETALKAEAAGTVTAVRIAAGRQVAAGDLAVELKPDSDDG